MAAVARHLLPDTAASDGGVLVIGGCRIDRIVAEHGTPLFVYDVAHIRNRCREAVAAFGGDNVVYASKAFLCKAMATLVHEEGLLIDVATGGEFHVARSAGVPASRLVVHGNNKSEDELARAMRAGVAHIVVDSFDEMDRIQKLYLEGLPAPRVHLRVTPGVHVHTHEFVATGQDDSKFGFNLGNGDAARAIERATRASGMDLVGLHCHIGSNVFSADNFARASESMVALCNSSGLRELTLGGGLGVAYVEGETAPTITEWADVLRRATAGLSGTRVLVEPGRAIVAAAAVTVYTVGTVKPIPGIRTYVAVDGGMSDNPRPMLYGSGYETFDPMRIDDLREGRARVVGKHCESGDVLVDDGAVPADLAVGDLLATPVTGAYGHSMGSNYNKVPRPPVVFVEDGTARLVVRRESHADLLRLDL